jgi:photosystem II stability/assembly factor-like uncharacterized protein
MPGPRQPLIRSGMTFAAFVLCLTVSPPTFSDSYDLESEDQDKCAGTMCPETFAGLEMRSVGPALMSGRIADIALHPHDPGTWYVAAGSGNLWKTTNAGTTWTPLFEDQGSYSLGCVTIDPHDPSTIWLGTGENVGGRHVGYGDGVYRSRDGGASWENLGLKASEHIGTIIVHPDDPGVVYVACQGPLWSAGGERGLYKSTDGGASWNKILGGGEYTGVNEVRMDPRDPDVLYATTHQRFRNVAALVNGGPETAIHKSTDGGSTWRKLTKGLPKEDMGKIGLAISPQKARRDLRNDRTCPPQGRVLPVNRRWRVMGKTQRLHFRWHRPALLPGDLRLSAPVRPRLPDGRPIARDRGRRQDISQVSVIARNTATTTPWPSARTILIT